MVPRPFAGILFLLLATAAAAQEPWVDPRLRILDRYPLVTADPQPLTRPVPGAPAERRGWGLADARLPVQRGPAGVPEIGLLVEVRTPGAVADLRRMGARVGTVAGNVVSVRVPVELVPALTRLSSLRRIEAPSLLRPLNDQAVLDSRLEETRRREGGEFLGTAGEGVVVGVIDTGLDYRHLDFRRPDGTPRTVALWDQVQNVMCDSLQLRALTCPGADPFAHGTHVAGIAAGDGSHAGNAPELAFAFAGAAPEAEIVAVRFSFQSDADLIDGVAWIFEQAASRGRPAVVNLSLGTQLGAHDGTSLLERGLSALTGPGRIIVAAAGNDGNAPNSTPELIPLLIHARAEPGPGSSPILDFRITGRMTGVNPCNVFVLFDIWYDGTQSVSFRVERPGGSSFTVSTGASASDSHPEGFIHIDAPASADPGNGDRRAQIDVSGCGQAQTAAPGSWRIELSSDQAPARPLDLWLALDSYGQGQFVFGEGGFDNRHIVAIPAAGLDIIAVGAHASRLCWPTGGGERCTADVFGFTQPLGDIAFFSSPGPTRDGRVKPEITAPGMMLMSALSSGVGAGAALTAPTGRHYADGGTSMATPAAAGAVALLLQHDPTLDPAGVRAILTGTAATDAFTAHDYSTGTTPGNPNPQWGYGKLDARAALETLVDPAVATRLWLQVASDTLPLGAVLSNRGLVLNAFGDSLGVVTSWTSADPSVATVDADGTVTPIAEGTTIITAQGGGLLATAFIEVVPPATLIVEATPVAPPPGVLSPLGARFPMLRLRLITDGHEGVLVDTLGFELTGLDPGARLVLARDVNADGQIDLTDPVLGDTVVVLDGTPQVILMTPDLVVPARDTVHLLAWLQLSGPVPHGSPFQLVFRPDLTSSVGIRSGAEDRRDDPTAVVASLQTGVIEPDELFNLSENPIRTDARRLVLNFAETPSLAGLYTLRGARVVDFRARLDGTGLRVEWDLTNDRGGMVAPGIYFLVARVGGTLIREKIVVSRAFGGDDD